ncbi:helix-turn-helix domain-containing protein [Brachybacterium halotolerans subsp. kimchii]|uniref:helix-turn-helix domain-containing protein n=1 Tax=Brachybacterium halotolerans TaxID=2795215 RepID=UPI001E2A7452|nr:helix-turn-helix domain-containing protein [Brachybacterium halotolerans]UEJ83010.1 helix-turn-helix domain-containing protein [Brachybacterium halotolerans subsp. kimchii]
MDATEPLLRELVGAALREERRRQGLTLARLAEASGVSMQHVSDVERGRKDPSSEVLAAITGALGISVFDIGRRVHQAAVPRSDADQREARQTAAHPGAARQGVVLDLTARGRDEILPEIPGLPVSHGLSSSAAREPMLSAA